MLTPSHHQTKDGPKFNNKDDIKYYIRGEKPLFSEREDKLDSTPDDINNFLRGLDERSQEYG